MPEYYNRAQSFEGWATVGAWAAALVAGVFVVLVCLSIGHALHARRYHGLHKKTKHIGRKE